MPQKLASRYAIVNVGKRDVKFKACLMYSFFDHSSSSFSDTAYFFSKDCDVTCRESVRTLQLINPLVYVTYLETVLIYVFVSMGYTIQTYNN